MENNGYGPNKRLQTKVTTRNLPPYRDPAILLIDQLKEIYIDGELELLDTTQWYPRLTRKEFTLGLHLITNSVGSGPGTLRVLYLQCRGRFRRLLKSRVR